MLIDRRSMMLGLAGATAASTLAGPTLAQGAGPTLTIGVRGGPIRSIRTSPRPAPMRRR